MTSQSYPQEVSDVFLQTPVETFGDAHATTAELAALRQLFQEQGSREATLASIKESGYPLPEEVTPEMVALTGARHACGVAIHLVETRGVEGKDSTYESYTTKNRFDRFVGLHIPKALRKDWVAPVARGEGIDNPTIKYPEGVDIGLVHGVAKPSRYLSAQTMRHLEFARLGKLDDATKEAMLITEAPLESFEVDWDKLIPVLETATDTVQLAGDIGANVAEQLLDNGLSNEQVAAILKKSYSIHGIKEEHGDIPEAEQTYEALVESITTSPKTAQLATLLR
jgi:hypothetical protein